ncbi:DASH family cryptochrome [Halomonas sp. QX-2]|jgi:deoxyribodipyrimidine photo-lyase|uniref:Cryptochrome DASH n=1 Tax=Vreelandella sedimenti TaxID=2729618 RepID=A0A7Z0SMM3_9GAMM|nr:MULTISPECIES: DASH family cryptochrome [Halomonas]NYT72293.1 DASH family cryptochrome [Halomonas sedimenti]|tara:strand:- start:17115 stop:18560 length:1446 start_codon:yes stop_codon:yes gene_type:complete
MYSTIDIVWLQDDLRIADNPLLHFTSPPSYLLCLYVLDEQWFSPLFDGESTPRIGPARLRFLWQSLMELRGELLKRGSDLLVRIGKPSDVVIELATMLNVRQVRVADHAGVDEAAHIQAVEQGLPSQTALECIESGRLIDRQVLPFEREALPGSFSAFRRSVEGVCTVPASRCAPVTLPPWPEAARGFPPLKAVCEMSATWQPDSRQGYAYGGGETAAHVRLDNYLWRQQGGKAYKKTRNGLLGANFSTRVSPWLARGCLSARQVYEAVKAWEAENGSNESSYWISFELLWREYFIHAAQLEGAQMFGSRQTDQPCVAFDAWRNGTTGLPFVDAAMRELLHTGWLSNRARQNVASFLVNDLKVDWRMGALWFEHCLIDYDVASNWGNWRYIAGVGRDPRQDRYFNVLKQAGHYDPQGLYVAHWLEQLETLPNGLERHQPWRADPLGFDAPCVVPEQWERWLIPLCEVGTLAESPAVASAIK